MGFTRATVGDKITAGMYNELANAPRIYTFATAIARGLESTMVKGDFAYQTDNDILYRYDGAAWDEWYVPWRSYVPLTTNISGGTVTATYSRLGDMVYVKILLLLAGANFTGQPEFSLPINHASSDIEWLDGTVLLRDSSPVTEILGIIRKTSVSAVNPYVLSSSTPYAQFANVSATVPFTWDVNDTLVMNFAYRAA